MEYTTPTGTTYLVEQTHEEPFSHSDLAEEVDALHDTRWERYALTPLTRDGFRSGPVIELLYLPEDGRAGFACGAEAAWTDTTSLDDAIERYLGIGDKELSN